MVGTHGGRLKIAIAAPATDGKANEALIQFLAGRLRLPQRQLHIRAGASSREKIVRIEAVSSEDVAARLQPQE